MPSNIFPDPCLIVLVGPSGAGKSTWAMSNFRPDEVISSDRLRAMVGTGQHDQQASGTAFELLEQIVDARLERRLLTVVDTLGLDDQRRGRWRDQARTRGIPAFVVYFDTDEALSRERNRARSRPVPGSVLTSQLRRYKQIRASLTEEGWDGISSPAPHVRTETRPGLIEAAGLQRHAPRRLRFFLQVSRFPWPAIEMRKRLTAIAQAAEEAGFEGVAVMDHLMQIPQVGRPWEDLPEAYVTLGYLAAATSNLRLGALVSGLTYRNMVVLAKMISTLDVLSGGRAFCGLGAGWFEQENQRYGIDFPPASVRLELLEDALQVLPLLWGPGSKAFSGKQIEIVESGCYPRPLQPSIPIIVGGSGERRTLRLAAQFADGCNLQGGLERIKQKIEVLRRHCVEVGRDPAEVEISCLDPLLVGEDRRQVAELVEQLRPQNMQAAGYAARVNAGTIDEQLGRYRQLAELGVTSVFVSLPNLAGPPEVKRLTPLVAEFARAGSEKS